MKTATTRATPALLWLRAALLAGVVLGVSVVSHASAGGLLPGPVSLVAALVVTAAVSARFLTTPASPLRIIGLLVSGQVLVHGFFSLTAGHHAGTPTGAAGRFLFDGRRRHRTGSYFDQVASMQAAGAPAPAPAGTGTSPAGSTWGHLVEHLAEQSPAMVLAHLLAVVALGVWLSVGEKALWAVLALTTTGTVALVRRLLRGVVAPLVVLGQVVPRAVACLARVVRGGVPLPWLDHVVGGHRGPPALLDA